VSNKKSFISSSKEEKKEKRSKRDSEEGGRVAGKQGSRRATSLLNLFTSSSSSSPNAQGRFLSLTLYSLSLTSTYSLFLFAPFKNIFQQGKKSIKKKELTDTRSPFLVSSRRANQQKPYCIYTGATSTHALHIQLLSLCARPSSYIFFSSFLSQLFRFKKKKESLLSFSFESRKG
jgi:hypothetical protein